MYIYIYICTYIYLCIYIYTYIHICIYVYRSLSLFCFLLSFFSFSVACSVLLSLPLPACSASHSGWVLSRLLGLSLGLELILVGPFFHTLARLLALSLALLLFLAHMRTPTLHTHCNTLQHTATHCNTLRRTAELVNTLQHCGTRCNTLQHAATQKQLSLFDYCLVARFL